MRRDHKKKNEKYSERKKKKNYISDREATAQLTRIKILLKIEVNASIIILIHKCFSGNIIEGCLSVSEKGRKDKVRKIRELGYWWIKKKKKKKKKIEFLLSTCTHQHLGLTSK